MLYVGSIRRGALPPLLTALIAGRSTDSVAATDATVVAAGAAAAASGANSGRLAICTTAAKAIPFSSLRPNPPRCEVGTLPAYPYCSDRQSSRRLSPLLLWYRGLRDRLG